MRTEISVAAEIDIAQRLRAESGVNNLIEYVRAVAILFLASVIRPLALHTVL